jgi:hypothetical protein
MRLSLSHNCRFVHLIDRRIQVRRYAVSRMLCRYVVSRVHVWFHSLCRDFQMRTLRFRIDEFEYDSGRIVIQNWIVIECWIDDLDHLVRQNKIDCFEYLRSDSDEYECLIRSEYVFLIGRRSDEFQLMKVIEMLKMMMTMMMIIELMIVELRVIVICSFEIACLEILFRMLFQLSRFESTFSQRSNSSSRLYT